MRRADLAAVARHNTGKGVARKLRQTGRVPAVLYGENKPPLPLEINRREFERVMVGVEGRNILVQLKIDGDEAGVMTLLKDIQYDPVHSAILHVDFLRVRMDHKIHTDVPIHLVGSPVGVREGGVLEFPTRQVQIACLPQDIPEYLALDVANLGIGQTLHVRDLPTAETYTILSEPERVVVSIISSARMEAAEAKAEAAAAAAAEAQAEGTAAGEATTKKEE